MAINIEIVTDVADVVKGTKDLADRYDEVSDALKDVAKAGDGAGSDLEKSFSDGEKAAEDLGKAGKEAGEDLEKGLKEGEEAAKDLDRKADEAFDAVSANAKRAGDKVGDSTKDGFKEAGEGVKEFGEEANSTARESAASFDGSAESIIDSFQEVAANAFAGFGPAGALAGLAAAAGIGFAVTKMQEGAEAADELKGKAIEMAGQIAEAGGRIEDLDLGGIISDWGREALEDNWITFWADESSTKFQETAKDAKAAGVEFSDAIKAAAGTADDSRRFLEGTGEAWQELSKAIEEGTTYTADGIPVQDEAAAAAQKQRDALSDLRGQAEENISTTSDAIEIAELEEEALSGVAESAEAAADAIRDKADASAEAAGAAMDVVGAENDWIETLAQMNEDIATNGKTLDKNTEAGRANRESLVTLAESANGYRDAAIAAGDGTASVTKQVQASRDAFIEAAIAAGYDAKAAAELADSYGLIPGNVETQVAAYGTEEAKTAIESIPEAKDTTVTTTETGADETQAKIDAVEGKEVEVEVPTPTADVAAVQTEIDGIKAKTVDIPLRISNAAQIREELRLLTLPREISVTVNQRPGKAVV